MRVLAARFGDRRAAAAARDRLMQRLRGCDARMQIAPLGVLGEPHSDNTVLAGHFPDEEAPVVAETVRETGGVIVTNVDEAWTRPRTFTRTRSWHEAFSH
jgi:hypothetical protein